MFKDYNLKDLIDIKRYMHYLLLPPEISNMNTDINIRDFLAIFNEYTHKSLTKLMMQRTPSIIFYKFFQESTETTV